jgi:VanZ family protein
MGNDRRQNPIRFHGLPQVSCRLIPTAKAGLFEAFMDTTLTPLKFERLWITLGMGFVLVVIYLSLTPDPPDLGMPEGLKIGHVLAYGWLMLWFAQIYRATGRRLLLAAAFCSLGIVLEYLQGMTDYRGFEYSDMLINSAGAALGLALAHTPLQNGLRTLEAVLRAR